MENDGGHVTLDKAPCGSGRAPGIIAVVPFEVRAISDDVSAVLEFGAPEPGETAAPMADKLRFHTDSWDLAVDLKSVRAGIVVIDARSREAYMPPATSPAR